LQLKVELSFHSQRGLWERGENIFFIFKILNMDYTNESINNKEFYNLAIETRNFEIKMFWQRSNYFLILCTAIATGVLLNLKNNIIFSIIISVFGIIVSRLWYKVNLGSKFWQTRWEKKTAEFEKHSTSGSGMNFFSVNYDTINKDVESFLQIDDSIKEPNKFDLMIRKSILKKPSVSKQMIKLSLFFMFFYIILLIISILQFILCKGVKVF